MSVIYICNHEKHEKQCALPVIYMHIYVSIKNGAIITGLYVKPTFFHAEHMKNSIP